MKILVKMASRGRPDNFFEALTSLYSNFADLSTVEIVCALDTDDLTMNNEYIIDKISRLPNLSVAWGTSESKIHAINRDVPIHDWDILIVLSDDIRFTHYGVDQFIKSFFVDSLDLMLHLPDQDEKEKVPVLYIAGRTFYERFGWIYNPVYNSLFPDTELLYVSKHLGCYRYENIPGLYSHLLPAYGHGIPDEQWLKQQEIGWTIDQQTFEERKANNFYL